MDTGLVFGIVAAVGCIATMCVVVRMLINAKGAVLYRTSAGEHTGLVVGFVVMLVGMFGYLNHDATRPLTPEELASAKWTAEEWTEIAEGTGIYQMPVSRRLVARRRTLQKEEFPETLARFVKKHPELEIVSTTAAIDSSGESTYIRYYTVVTRPKK